MATANRAVVNVSVGGWYPRGLQRIRDTVRAFRGPPVIGWSDALPPGAVGHEVVPYGYKPFAMAEAFLQGHNVLLWLDSACFPIKPLDEVFEHIEREGYLFCGNGWPLACWSSDAALRLLGIDREAAFYIPELTSYCLGLDLRQERSRIFLEKWRSMSEQREGFVGAHTNEAGLAEAKRLGVVYRGIGPVSTDPRVLGHRHDQTCATGIAWNLGMRHLCNRPWPTDYWSPSGPPKPETVILNRGM